MNPQASTGHDFQNPIVVCRRSMQFPPTLIVSVLSREMSVSEKIVSMLVSSVLKIRARKTSTWRTSISLGVTLTAWQRRIEASIAITIYPDPGKTIVLCS